VFVTIHTSLNNAIGLFISSCILYIVSRTTNPPNCDALVLPQTAPDNQTGTEHDGLYRRPVSCSIFIILRFRNSCWISSHVLPDVSGTIE